MKRISTLVIILIFTSNSYAQNFAPTGAVWHYGEGYNGPGNSFIKIESVKDTLFNGKNCNLLVKSTEVTCSGRPLEVLVYEEDSVTYFWDEDFDEFQILYDLKKQIGESWNLKIKSPISSAIDTLTVTVNSTSFEDKNGVLLKKLNVIHLNSGISVYSATILEKIGDPTFLFNYFTDFEMICDINYSTGLRCYEDPNFGFYTTNSAISCEFDNVSLVENEKSDFIIFPNPATDKLIIKNELDDFKSVKIQLLNSFGEIVLETISRNEIDISKFESGIYILKVSSNESSSSKKVVIFN